MVEILQPLEWGCPDPSKPQTPVHPEYKKAVCHHNIGNLEINEDYPSAQRARNIVAFHMGIKGWTWDGYDYMVGADGIVYAVHDCKTESFAEGKRRLRQTNKYWEGDKKWWSIYGKGAFKSWNWRHFSILWMIGANYTPSQVMIDAVNDLQHSIIHRFPQVKYVVPHRGLQIKDCPGNAVTALINRGKLGPTPVSPNTPWPWQAQADKPTKASDYQNAIRVGITDGSNPEKLGTREDMAVMAYRALRKARE